MRMSAGQVWGVCVCLRGMGGGVFITMWRGRGMAAVGVASGLATGGSFINHEGSAMRHASLTVISADK